MSTGELGRTREDLAQMRQKYISLRMSGNSREKACELAGFNPNSRSDVERNVKKEILSELDCIGLDEAGLAMEYAWAMDKVRQADPNFDGQAYAKLLLQVGYLRGHGAKESPTVAVQINNNSGPSQVSDPRAVGELARLVAEELSRRDAAGVSGERPDVAGGSEILAEAETHSGVVPPGGDGIETPGGGQP